MGTWACDGGEEHLRGWYLLGGGGMVHHGRPTAMFSLHTTLLRDAISLTYMHA